MAIRMSSSTLRQKLQAEDSVAVVLFSGEWCPDCRMFKPTWDQWAAGKSVPTYVVDVPRGGSEWDEWRLEEIPTVAAFSRGIELERVHGTIERMDLDGLIRALRAMP